MSRRRFRQRPAVAGLPFTDSADTSAEIFEGAGAPQFFGATGVGAPLPIVHRSITSYLVKLDERSPDSDAALLRRIRRGYGALSPMEAPKRRSPIVSVGGSFVPRRVVSKTPSLQARRHIAQSWRAFNALRFRVPQKERICVQRRIRKGVLFARGVAGRSGGSAGRFGTYHRSRWSAYSCR